jgi:hypothetical protein
MARRDRGGDRQQSDTSKRGERAKYEWAEGHGK